VASALIYVVDLVPDRLEILPSHPYTPARFPLEIIIDRYRDSRRAGKGWHLGWDLGLGLFVGLILVPRNGGWFVLLQKVAHHRLGLTTSVRGGQAAGSRGYGATPRPG
jgi:hypothetical protein